MLDRRTQLRAIYQLDFPDELFEFWAWHRALEAEAARAFREVLGISLHGPYDALAGKFDDRELRYPAVLHWRYQYDPPELFTVMTGNIDGLHWGYWFDDPGRVPPVVASFYARDAFELTQHGSLFEAVATHLEATHLGTEENRQADRAHLASYDRDLAALDALGARLPAIPAAPNRKPAAMTREGMGIVVAPELLAPWRRPAELDRAKVLAFVDAEIATGRPGTALLVGKTLWDGAKSLAFDVLVRAYAALDREPLRAVAAAHREHPALPSLDLLSYEPGDYSDVREAVAHRDDARKLEIHGRLEALDPAVGELANLVEASLGGNRLTTLPAALARCTKLETLNLYNNRLTDVPAELFDLPALRTLQLGKNSLASLAGVARCRSLVELDLSQNPIARLPDDIGELAALKSLDLGGTLVSDDELARLRAALPTANILARGAGPATPYSTNTTFAVDDKLHHPTLGVGVVRKLLADGKLAVAFASGEKTLVHGRK